MLAVFGIAFALITTLSVIGIVTLFVTTLASKAPTARNDMYTANKGIEYTFDVLANDDDQKNRTLNIEKLDRQPLFGSVSVTEDGTKLIYKAPKYYAGIDTFVYRASNGQVSSPAEVQVDVQNIPLVAIDISYHINRGQKFQARLFEYKNKAGKAIFDADGDRLYIHSIEGSPRGIVEIASDGQSIFYTGNHAGMDTMRYVISDYNSTATATLQFTTENGPPVAVADEYRNLSKDKEYLLDVLENDIDPNGDKLHIVQVSNVCSGANVYLHPSNTNSTHIRFVPSRSETLLEPAAGYPTRTGCTFQYTISDGTFTSTASVYLTLKNELPSASIAELVLSKNGYRNSAALKLSDADAFDSLNARLTDRSPLCTLQLTQQKVVHKPGYIGDSTLPVTEREFELVCFPGNKAMTHRIPIIVDDGYDSIEKIASVRVVNDNPIARNDLAECKKNEECVIRHALDNDSDPNGDMIHLDLSFKITSFQGGTVKVATDLKTLIYSPPRGFTGSDMFTYRITDIASNDAATAGTSTADVRINVAPYTSPPPPKCDHATLSSPVFKRTTNEIDIMQVIQATDPDDRPLSVRIGKSTDPQFGDFQLLDGTHGSLRFVAGSLSGIAAAEIVLSNGVHDSSCGVQIDVKNRRPIANHYSYALIRRSCPQEMFFNVIRDAQCTDPDGDNMYPMIESIHNCGNSIIGVAQGMLHFSVPPCHTSTCYVTYSVIDDDPVDPLKSEPRVITISFHNNQAPVARDDSFSYPSGVAISIPVSAMLANDDDPNGDGLSIDASYFDQDMCTGSDMCRNGKPSLSSDARTIHIHSMQQGASDMVFQYRTQDSSGAISNTARVTIRTT